MAHFYLMAPLISRSKYVQMQNANPSETYALQS